MVGMRSFACNPYAGHILTEALEHVKTLTDQHPNLVVVDRGCRGHGAAEATCILISGARRGLTPRLTADLRRRSAIEAEIDHMKTDGRLSRWPLKCTDGDAALPVLNGCGHNISKILAHLRVWFAWIIAVLWTAEILQTTVVWPQMQREAFVQSESTRLAAVALWTGPPIAKRKIE